MTLTRRELDSIADELDAELDAGEAARYRQRFNVAPTDLHWLLIADQDKRRRIVPAIWGLSGKQRPLINVRAESIQRGAFRHHRHGLAIADGFYEWRGGKGARQPLWYHRPASGLLLLATVDAPLGGSAKAAIAFSVVTVAANEDTAPVHDRMPAIIAPSAVDEWLGQPALELLTPPPPGTLVATEVSSRVNYVEHDDAACLEPAPQERSQPPQQLSLLDKH
jgi:putative SOS response-associated peptidase YedK